MGKCRTCLSILVVFAAMLGYVVKVTLDRIQFSRELTFLNDKDCIKYEGFVGAEDLVLYRDFLIWGSHDFFSYFETLGDDAPMGSLWAANTLKKPMKPVKLEMADWDPAVPFRPHGLYVVRAKNLLYVLNHSGRRGNGDRIEIFELEVENEELTIKWSKALLSTPSHMGVLNDIAVTRDGLVYATQWLAFPSGYQQVDIANYTQIKNDIVTFFLRWTNIWLISETETTLAATGGYGYNGIALNEAQDRLFVADPITAGVRVFKRFENNSLEFLADVPTYYGVDNMELSLDGEYITLSAIGRIVNHLTAKDYARKNGGKFGVGPVESEREPGGAQKFTFKNDEFRAEPLVMQDGTRLSGISGAVHIPHLNAIALGSWGDNGILVCSLPTSS